LILFLSNTLPPPISTLFPYTTLFRSDCPGENLFRFRTRSIDLQSLRARPDQGLVVRDLAFTGSGWSLGCHVFDRRGRLSANGLRSEEHTSELQSRVDLVCRLLLEKKK